MITDEGLPTGIELADLAAPAWEHELRGPDGRWVTLYHGSVEKLEPGSDQIKPYGNAYFTTRKAHAWDYATMGGTRPGYVYTVEPTGKIRGEAPEVGMFSTKRPLKIVAREDAGSQRPPMTSAEPVYDLAAWEHEQRDAHGEWVKMGGGGWEGRDRALEEWFHPQQLDASTVPHPVTGYAIKTGKELRVSRPPETSHGNESLGAEGPPTFDVYDHPGLDRSRGMFPVKTGTEPIRHVYRGVSETEWQQAQQRGYLQSDSRGTISSLEGTNAAVDPSSAVSYLPSGSGHSRVLKIEVRPEDRWFTIRADSYLRTRQRVPVDRVVAVSPPIRKHGKYDELQVQQLTTEMASPASDVTLDGAVSILRQLQGKDGIAAQVTELGWHDAWMHEPRGPHGEWVREAGGAEPSSPYNFKGPFAKSDALKQIETWYNRNRSGTDVLIGLLNAYSALQASDFVGAAMHLRTAAKEAEARTKGPSKSAVNYLRMADQMESRHRMMTLLPGKMAAIVTTAAPRVLEMIGGGRQKWDGQVHVFVQADDPSVAGSMSWGGRMRIADQSAEEITRHADSSGPWLPGHADSVPLHEIIHGIVGPQGKEADQAAYRTKAGAAAEEGFTELGTALHMPGYLDAIGHGHRETAIIAVNDAGHIREVFNRQAMFEFQDEFRVIERMQGSSQVRGTGSMTAYNALTDARYELFRPEVDVAKMTGHLAQAAQSTPDPEVRARILALMQKLNVADTETKHVTVSEYADRLADPERIANGQAWGAYAWQTRNALQWVQGITDAEGYMQRGKGTDGWQRVIQLANEINQTGPAGKFDVMARQILRSEHIEPDVGEGWLVGRLSENIAQLWPTEASQDAASLVPRLRTIAQTLVSEYRRRLAEKYGANA